MVLSEDVGRGLIEAGLPEGDETRAPGRERLFVLPVSHPALNRAIKRRRVIEKA